MPLTQEYLPYLMFLWVFSGVIVIRKVELNYSKIQWLLILFPAIFYLFHVIGMIHTSDFKSGLFDLEVKLSLLFAPIVMLFLTHKVKQNINLVIKAFILGNLVALAICLFRALDHSLIINEAGKILFEPSYWSSEQGSSFFQLINQRYSHFSYSFFSFIHHPSYFSMYVLFATCLLIYLYRKYNKRNTVRSILVFSFMIIFLSLMIWFLGSRAGYLSFIVVFVGVGIVLLLKTQRYLVSLSFIIGGFVLLTFFMSPKLKKNFQEVIHQVENQQELTSDSDIRLWLWKSGMEVFKKNYFWGVGTGDIKIVMNKKYHQYNLSLAEEKSYNLHNQYLESAVSLGFIGLLILITWMVLLFFYAINTKDFLLFFLTLIISIHFMFESMLNSIAGVSFFMFFYVLLLAKNYTHGKEFN
jgi:O-antigen ligase